MAVSLSDPRFPTWDQGLTIPMVPDPDPYKPLGSIHSVEEFTQHVRGIEGRLGLNHELPISPEILTATDCSPLATPRVVGGRSVGNSCCIQPMEGWDGTVDGQPSEHTIRRWIHFGISGAKLIWGGEAFAVEHQGRANPCQLFLNPSNLGNLEEMGMLAHAVYESHEEKFGKGASDDLLLGLQLTHSGRWSKPNHNDRFESKVAYEHPLLPNNNVPLSDREVGQIVKLYVKAAKMAEQAGFRFLDIKACHGYLGHEFLSAYHRKGPYGGSFENRTRFLSEIIYAVKEACPDMLIGSRLSVYDTVPFLPDREVRGRGRGREYTGDARYPAFGVDPNDHTKIDLTEPIKLIDTLLNDAALKIDLLNITAGSPYYSSHIQRPTQQAPLGAFEPPENPIIGALRLIEATATIQRQFPQLPIVGSGYSIFQQYFPHVAQGVLENNGATFVGPGRGFLSYWDLFSDCLSKGKIDEKRICRAVSFCTTGPRTTDPVTGLPLLSGCYPYDEYYRDMLDKDGNKIYQKLLAKMKEWRSSR